MALHGTNNVGLRRIPDDYSYYDANYSNGTPTLSTTLPNTTPAAYDPTAFSLAQLYGLVGNQSNNNSLMQALGLNTGQTQQQTQPQTQQQSPASWESIFS